MNVSAAAGHSVALSFTGGVYTWVRTRGAAWPRRVLGARRERFRSLSELRQEAYEDPHCGEQLMPQMKPIAAGGHVTGGTEKVLEGGHIVSVSLTNEVWGWATTFTASEGTGIHKGDDFGRCTPRTSSTMSPESTTIGKYCLCASVHCGSLRQPSPPPPPAFPAPPGTVAQNHRDGCNRDHDTKCGHT